jgi:hypothetical protein
MAPFKVLSKNLPGWTGEHQRRYYRTRASCIQIRITDLKVHVITEHQLFCNSIYGVICSTLEPRIIQPRELYRAIYCPILLG